MTILKPMLAATVDDISLLRYPLLATPKIDGIRCVIHPPVTTFGPSQVLSRNLKPIPNLYITSILASMPPDMDGELVCPGGFNATQSAVMSIEGCPPFSYRIFDFCCDAPYFERIGRLKKWLEGTHTLRPPWISPVYFDQINNEEELFTFEAIALEKGYEGVMLRKPTGPYKFGRSTFKEHYLLKLKRFLDSEAVIEDFEEKEHNANEATTDNLGHAKRSSHKSGMVGAGTLGSVWVRDCKTSLRFSIGTGFDDVLRAEIWRNRSAYRGKTITYKFQPSGMKDLPRFPVFKGFRQDGE